MAETASNRFSVVSGAAAADTRQRSMESNELRFSYIIADDHPSVRLAVAQLMSEVVGCDRSRFVTFAASTDLLAACSEPSPEQRLIVLDLVMPGALKRVCLVRAVVRADPSARILVYTADESSFLAQAVMDAGALGYVAKTSPAAELMDAVRTLREGRCYVDTRINLESVTAHPWSSLTDSERVILLALCRGQKPAEIVADTGRSYSTVTTHKYNGLKKLGLRDGDDLLPYIYTNGLVHELDAGSSDG